MAPASRRVVDRGAVRDRLCLLSGRSVSRFRAAGRLGRRRHRVLRRLAVLHLGGADPVSRGGQRRPRPFRRSHAPARFEPGSRLVGDPDPARRHRVLQHQHLPRDAAELRHLAGRPARLGARGGRLDLLRDLRPARLPRGPRRRPAAGAAHARVEDLDCQLRRLHPLRDLGDRRLGGARRPATCSTSRRPT